MMTYPADDELTAKSEALEGHIRITPATDESKTKSEQLRTSRSINAPERNLWSSLFATDRSDFRRYSVFDGSYENTCRHAYTYPDIGFFGKIVAKMVRAKVLEIVKFVQILQA